MPDDRYSDWVKIKFCGGEECTVLIEEDDIPGGSCPNCGHSLDDAVVGLFSPEDAYKIRR